MKALRRFSAEFKLGARGSRTLLVGIGNSGRSDDGLGWAFVETIQQSSFCKGDAVFRYQLQIEDAELISRYDRVLFVDAYKGSLSKGFRCDPVEPEVVHNYSTHALEPGAVLGLCHELYDAKPVTFVMMIQGVDWDLNIGLSEQAKVNLASALKYFTGKPKFAYAQTH